ncbi:hypothetical protein BV898_04190 [Hypsibius exemplaris]|uniref:Bulb-type lectin domain-containing protein n=1 Tax=Hypsibius exemplaris TaxID=2072580 RepID=A0A1W0X3A5_HYPEX|nr:hypothetical protein BV898_04190 [Hypsibius exemplaris]
MKSGDNLTLGQTLWSPNRTCSLSFRTNGHLILRRHYDDAEIWVLTKKARRRVIEEAAHLMMQPDGQLVLHGRESDILWNLTWAHQCQSATQMKLNGADLRIAEDCRLCVYRDGYCHWTSSIRKSFCVSANSMEGDEEDDDAPTWRNNQMSATLGSLCSGNGNYSGLSLAIISVLSIFICLLLLAGLLLLARWYTNKDAHGMCKSLCETPSHLANKSISGMHSAFALCKSSQMCSCDALGESTEKSGRKLAVREQGDDTQRMISAKASKNSETIPEARDECGGIDGRKRAQGLTDLGELD